MYALQRNYHQKDNNNYQNDDDYQNDYHHIHFSLVEAIVSSLSFFSWAEGKETNLRDTNPHHRKGGGGVPQKVRGGSFYACAKGTEGKFVSFITRDIENHTKSIYVKYWQKTEGRLFIGSMFCWNLLVILIWCEMIVFLLCYCNKLRDSNTKVRGEVKLIDTRDTDCKFRGHGERIEGYGGCDMEAKRGLKDTKDVIRRQREDWMIRRM